MGLTTQTISKPLTSPKCKIIDESDCLRVNTFPRKWSVPAAFKLQNKNKNKYHLFVLLGSLQFNLKGILQSFGKYTHSLSC